MGTRFVFPMKVMPWNSLSTSNNAPVVAGERMNAVGFIPVYESIQAMIEDHGNDIDSRTFVEAESGVSQSHSDSVLCGDLKCRQCSSRWDQEKQRIKST